MNNIDIPDIKGGDLKIKNIKFTIAQPPQDQVVFSFDPAGNAIKLTLSQVTASMSAKAVYRLLFFDLTGTVKVNMKNMTLSATLHLDKYVNGDGQYGPAADVTYLKISVNDRDVDIKLTGDIIAQFGNLIIQLFKGEIIGLALGEGEKAAKSALNDIMTKELRSFPLMVDIPETPLAIDYSLGSAPVVLSDHLELHLDGTILNKDHKDQRPPFEPEALPGYIAGGKSVQFFFSPYTFNSVLYALFIGDFFNKYIPSSLVPDSSPFQLDTTTFGIIIPEFVELYGLDKKIDMQCNVHEMPGVSLTKTNMSGHMTGACSFIVNIDDDTQEVAMVLDADAVNFTILGYFDDMKLYGEFVSVIVEGVELKESKIGDADIEELTELLNNLFEFAIPAFNGYLEDGIELPSVEGITFGDSEILYDPTYLEIGNTPQYNMAHIRDFLGYTPLPEDNILA